MPCIMSISHLWIFFGALVSSNAADLRRICTDLSINTSLKSEVFLPCHFNISFDNETVLWRHFGETLLSLRTNGSIYFISPREGRVKVFPLLFKEGNFSILIHDLEPSDLGTYVCEMNSECWKVKFTQFEERPVERHGDLNPWYYFAAGAGLFILLFIAFSLFSKFFGKNMNGSSKSSHANGVPSEGNNPTEGTQNTESSGHRNNNKRGVRRGPTVVYENDVFAPNQSSAAQHPQRAFRAVPEPTPLDVKPYYVNQAEISAANNAGKRRKKQKHVQIKNPIYEE